MRTSSWLLILAFLVAGCCCAGGAVNQAQAILPTPAASAVVGPIDAAPRGIVLTDDETLVEMRNVHFRVDRRLTLNIRRLQGSMVTRGDHAVVDFGDPASFYLDLAYAEIGMTMPDLSYLLQRFVFGYDGSPLAIHEIDVEGDEIRQVGTLHNVVDIPFEMTAAVEATPEGLIRLRPTSMQICSIPGQGLMQVLGIDLEQLLDLSGATGVTVEGNDLLMDPERLLPPPAIRGLVTAVRVENGELVQIFGSPDAAPDLPERPVSDAPNYMFYSGGTLRFGKLFMVDADLQIIDDDPSDPFDFFLQEYLAQLVAGRSRTMPDAGLAAYFPDYADLTTSP